jgi:hypothetical protein
MIRLEQMADDPERGSRSSGGCAPEVSDARAADVEELIADLKRALEEMQSTEAKLAEGLAMMMEFQEVRDVSVNVISYGPSSATRPIMGACRAPSGQFSWYANGDWQCGCGASNKEPVCRYK